MNRLKAGLLIVAAVSVAFLTGCDKQDHTALNNNENNKDQEPTELYGASHLIVKMTDAPAVFDSVNVDIMQVSVHYCTEVDDDTTVEDSFQEMDVNQPMAAYKDGDDDWENCDTTEYYGWLDLETAAGIYNLLDLQNNVTAVLVNSDTIPSGHITQMRLILGENNYVVVDSTMSELKTPSAQQSGLKINLDATFEEGQTYEIVLDFDAEESIVVTGNGKYILKPVIKVVSVTEVGS